MSVHNSATGYESAAKIYAGGRPGYPGEAVAWLRDTVGVEPGRTTLEVGAGTGKFIPCLLEFECRGKIIAVEPIEAMRRELKEAFPDVLALEGSAEAIPLPDRSVNAVVCAQAFHGFATAAALEEMHRVLVPGGVPGSIWNGRDESENSMRTTNTSDPQSKSS
ncbi:MULTISPECIES: class I SAM-dependent methyltransferase [Comamonadaceae]|uniref:class I SAM-dependent methyltransferase n=1 Tax=Acidovorax sacchari TaxID=3230736 RepID=UPI0034A43E5E